jgi:hypothetical protein
MKTPGKSAAPKKASTATKKKQAKEQSDNFDFVVSSSPNAKEVPSNDKFTLSADPKKKKKDDFLNDITLSGNK